MLATAAPRAVFQHETVLRDEALALLGPALGEGRIAVDCTAGGGGHVEGLLATGATVLAIDRDPAALDALRVRLGSAPGLKLVHADFRDLEAVVARQAGGPVDAILADLGVSSPQLDRPERGFSMKRPGPLDMRMDPGSGPPLARRLAQVDVETLTRVLREFGEERHARRVARAILAARDAGTLTDTVRLAEVVRGALPKGPARRDPATRTFQALRIWVNDELGALDDLLAAIPKVLRPGGRVAIIAFHSLEDRRVKQAFRALTDRRRPPPDLPVPGTGTPADFELLTRRALRPTEEEMRRNPRARSARLRALRRREGSDAA